MMRATRSLLLSRGRFSSMLDMAGVASADSNMTLDMGKNNKLRVVALDFNLISVESKTQSSEIASVSTQDITGGNEEDKISDDNFRPNFDMAQTVATLFNLRLGGERKRENPEDMSRLTEESNGGTVFGNQDEPPQTNNIGAKVNSDTIKDCFGDVRVKYAQKIRSKIEGGVAGLELAKSQRDETLKKGDAPGHLIARSIAASSDTSISGSKWLLHTSTGSLLSFLNQRSMKIALMPLPSLMDAGEKKKEREQMVLMTEQLPKIKFDLLAKDLEDNQKSIDETVEGVLTHLTAHFSNPPISTLVVSDRDDYLHAARERGMYTCRVRRKNKPRGNVTTNFNVEEVAEVEDVVNEINGISFNSFVSKSN